MHLPRHSAFFAQVVSGRRLAMQRTMRDCDEVQTSAGKSELVRTLGNLQAMKLLDDAAFALRDELRQVQHMRAELARIHPCPDRRDRIRCIQL